MELTGYTINIESMRAFYNTNCFYTCYILYTYMKVFLDLLAREDDFFLSSDVIQTYLQLKTSFIIALPLDMC